MTAHAMSVLREEMLCMACLVKEAAVMAAYRASGQFIAFARDPEANDAPGRSRRDLDVRLPSRTPAAEGVFSLQELRP